jgi:carbon monoxide dehydrogenase subunit G
MLNIVILIVVAIAVAIAILFICASTKPDIFHVERSIDIKATPERIFPFINDFHQWDAWTPYNKDPGMQKSYSGSDSGKGAHYAWTGNKKVGQGEITITDTTPPNQLVFDLHMIKPFEGRNVATFSLIESGDSTKVTWGLDDKHTLKLKVITLFLNLDQVIGKDFEVGLTRLKALVEK